MRKLKRFISGFMAAIMLSAIIAPLIEVLPVYAATPTQEYPVNGTSVKITMLEEFSVGTRALKSDAVSPAWLRVFTDHPNVNPIFIDEDSSTGKYLQFGGAKAGSDDFDGDDWDFVQTASDLEGSGYILYTQYLKKIESQGESFSGTGLVSIEALPEKLKEALGCGDVSTELLPIWAMITTNAEDGDNTGQFLACDFNASTMKFVYYYVGAKRQSGKHDDFLTCVFYSDTFFAMSEDDVWYQDVQASNNDGFDDIGDNNGGHAETDSTQYIENVCAVVNLLSDNGSLFESIFTNKTITSEQKNKIEMIDSLLNYVKSGDTGYIKSSIEYGFSPSFQNGSDRISVYPVIIKIDDDTDNYYDPFEVEFTITADFLTWGSTEKSFIVNDAGSSDDAQRSLKYLAATIINGCATAGGAGTCAAVEEILPLLPNQNSGFTYNLLYEYKSKLNEAIEKGAIEQITENAGELNIQGSETDFSILNTLLTLSVQKAVDSISLDAVYKTPSGKLIDMRAASSTSTLSTGCTTSVPLLWDSLSNYQKSLLSTAYYEKLKALSIDKNDVGVLSSVYQAGANGPIDSYTYADLGSGGKPDQATVEYTKELIAKYHESDLVNTGLVTNVARNANVLTHYVVVSTLYDADIGSGNAEDIYAVYDANLESLIKEQWLYKNTSTSDYQQNYFAYLPDEIPLLGANSENYKVLCANDANWDRFVNLLFNTAYAFDTMSFSEFGEENDYTPEQVAAWLEGEGDDNIFQWINDVGGLSAYQASSIDPPFNGDDFSINLIRSIIELHDMCEFLGIPNDGWSESIKLYLDLYDKYEDFFNAMRSNYEIYKLIEQAEQSVEEPLAMFFTIEGKSVSDDWAKGFALSSLYVPMETNLYDASSVAFINDGEWVADFFYKYGFYRKALYINTDNSCIVNEFVSGTTSGGTRPATLNDLLNYDRDIILTVDDNFYNADDINSVISNLDYTGIRNTATTESSVTGLEAAGNWVSDQLGLGADEVLKTGSAKYYSETLIDHTRKFGQQESDFDLTANMVDAYVLPQSALIGEDSVFEDYEYSVKQSYGVVSAVYRSPELYNETLNSLVSDNAIFKSSKSICAAPGTTTTDWRSVYNYCMLSNLEEQMKNDTASTLDLDAPIFCDLFGNIVTESGLVIIPAASNATLCGTNWTPYTVAFAEYYNNGNKINVTEFSDSFVTWAIGREYTTLAEGSAEDNQIDLDSKSVKENAGGYFEVATNGDLILKATSMSSGNLSAIIQWEVLNKNSNVIQQIFFNDAYFDKAANLYGPRFVNLVIEVLRGAPIEHIDYTFEGIGGKQNISKYGIYMAYKFEEILDAIMPSTNGEVTGGNSVVTMPNLAFMPGVEVIMLYAFKIAFAVLIVALVIQLYLDAVKNHLGFKSVGKFIVTCFMIIAAFTVVPTLITWSYYNANKTLLKSETGKIAMLNYVKDFDGSEIGITSVTTPETQTELYIKLDDVAIEWWTIIGDVLFGNTYQSVTELYEAQATDHPYANYANIVTQGEGMYISVDDVFNSTDINYRPTSKVLVNTMYTYATVQDSNSAGNVTVTNAPLSYTMPYYVILDQLIANINEYNTARDISAFSWNIGSNGHIMTYDICTPYLTSAEFLDEGMDILGMYRILCYEDTSHPLYNFAFNDAQKDSMTRSLWYPSDNMSETERRAKIEEFYMMAREYVADNQDILGKVPDEVFLKTMALQLAIEYNRIFNIPYGNSIEIMNIDTRDLMRFMVADADQVYKYYSYSFARFTYEQSGGIGVIFSALLLVVLWLTGFIKPLFMIIILGLLIINCVFRKVIFQKESRCIEGYLIGSACLVLTNYAYAGMLKVSMMIAGLGLGSVLSLVVGFVVQVVYVALLCLIMFIEIKDWKNNGFNEFAAIGSNITSSLLKTERLLVDKLVSKVNQPYADASNTRRYMSDNFTRETLEQMHERDAEREERGNYSIT